MTKTNAMRILDGLKIPYSVHEYNDDGEHILKKGVAKETAQKLSLDPNKVFKTIVMTNEEGENIVFCQNALHEINLKKARAASKSNEITILKEDKLLSVTGYVRGGCSPIGMKKHLRTFIDESAKSFDTIFISAGVRGKQLEIAPSDLQKVTSATFCDLVL